MVKLRAFLWESCKYSDKNPGEVLMRILEDFWWEFWKSFDENIESTISDDILGKILKRIL